MRGRSLILTYHRVVDDGAASGFYDVPLSQFRDHVARAAARKGGMPILFTFDDGTRDHLRVADILAEHGIGGVFFLVVDRLGQPDHIARGEVRHLVELNQIVGSHTLSHRALDAMSDTDLASELADSRQELEDLSGGTVRWFAAPGGRYDGRSLSVARAAGYRYVRTMDWGYAPDLESAAVGRTLLRTVPVVSTMSARRFETVLDGRAKFGGFALKQLARRILPASAYVRLRDWAAGAQAAR